MGGKPRHNKQDTPGDLSVSSLKSDLVAEALKVKEDVYFSRSSDEALKQEQDEALIEHVDAWP